MAVRHIGLTATIEYAAIASLGSIYVGALEVDGFGGAAGPGAGAFHVAVAVDLLDGDDIVGVNAAYIAGAI